MAKLTKEEFINSLNEMSILEIKELVDAMKEAYGVDPSAVAVAGPAVAAVEEGPSKVNVVLTAAGANKIAVIKLVRDLTGLGLKEAKDIADNGGNVKEGIDKEEAENMRKKVKTYLDQMLRLRLGLEEVELEWTCDGVIYKTVCVVSDTLGVIYENVFINTLWPSTTKTTVRCSEF